jgi:hypothetical protein
LLMCKTGIEYLNILNLYNLKRRSADDRISSSPE